MTESMNKMHMDNGFIQDTFRDSSKRESPDNDMISLSPRKHNIVNPQFEEFKKKIQQKYDVKFNSYFDLHKWTIDNCEKFWEEIWNYLGMIHSRSYEQILVKTGENFLDCEWFKGALFNFAENCLLFRDDRIAISYLDEYLNEETVTYAEMFETVKLYAAAFRKNGLKKGDRVACFMSNRKEAFFAVFAALSVGAVWGAVLPFYSARGASNILKTMEPKFLITVDSHSNGEIEYPLFDYLPTIVDKVSTLERVIIVVTKTDTYKKDTSHIPNSVFLEDFLKEGREPDGSIPDINFEQLPADHPIFIIFTSGTTKLPKAVVHCARSILSMMLYSKLVMDIKKDEVLLLGSPAGWMSWNMGLIFFASGANLFLLCGSPFILYNGLNYWDICGKYAVNRVFLPTASADKLEKMNLIPKPDTNLENLKRISFTAYPLKKENISYILNRVKADVFIQNRFASTEMYGPLSGFDPNSPFYGTELQVPALGMDIQCFDEQGNSVIGQRGELVICTPSVGFTIGLWKDSDKSILQKKYLSKYPGVWYHGDECWINPKTKGLIIFGRSDDRIGQPGQRFSSSDIYFAIHHIEELRDYVCVGQRKYNGCTRAVLFVEMKPEYKFTPEMKAKIEKTIEDALWKPLVPELILEVAEIPYNLNNKRMESLVRTIVATNKIPEVENVRNPSSLKYYVNIPEILSYNQQ